MKKYLHKTITLTSFVTIGALCFGAVPANAVSSHITPVINTEKSIPSNTLNNREQITEVFNQVNAHRKANGLKPLMFSVPASEESQNWSKKIAADQKLSHNSNPGTDPRIKAVWWGRWSENVAARWDNSGKGMFDQWVNSPGHNKNMLDPNVNTIGIGFYITGNSDFVNNPSNYYMWGTQNFYNFDEILPAQTYAHPDDYFEGRASLDDVQLKNITIKNPSINYDAGTYTLPAVDGVEYSVNGIKKTPGTYPSNWEKVTIDYLPLAGWKHTTTDNKYSVTIDFTQYLQQVEVPVPEFNDVTGKYTINGSDFVDYYANGVQKSTGTYDSGWNKITITAKAHAGYIITGTSSWSHTFTKPVSAVTPKAPAFDKVSGKYTIPATTGVQYKVNDVTTQAGTYNSGWKKITVTAVAATGYKLSGTTSWSYTFVKPAVVVTAKAPTFNKTTGQYIIPATTGVQYRVNGVNTKAGTYNSGWKKITVTTVATAGYKLSGTTSWSYTFVKPAVVVKPKNPVFNKTTGKYSIPTTTGVQYRVNGVNTKAGTYNSGWKKITVTAVAKSGYKLSGTTSWSYTFVKPRK